MGHRITGTRNIDLEIGMTPKSEKGRKQQDAKITPFDMDWLQILRSNTGTQLKHTKNQLQLSNCNEQINCKLIMIFNKY